MRVRDAVMALYATRYPGADLAPLPIFGFPGWFPDGERAEFYDDARYFRPLIRSPLESARQPLRASAEESPGSAERDAG